MKIAVAIINWNGKHWLGQFLPSLLTYTQDADIYLIDNASTDGSVEFVAQHFPGVKIRVNEENIGFSEGYNRGLSGIDADIYCLLNSDVEVTENWVSPVVQLFREDDSIAAIQPKILDFNNRKKFEFSGAGGGMLDNLGYPYCRGRIFQCVEQDIGQYDDETEIFWASGCCLFIRSKDFVAMGGFDRHFFAHQEEIDLCWRLKNAGRKIYYTGRSTVYHVGGGTLGKENPKKTFLNIRNNLSMLLKNLPFSSLFWVIPLRMVLDGWAAVYLGIKKGFPHFLAVLRAHLSFWGQFPRMYGKRGRDQMKIYYNERHIVFRYWFNLF